MRDFSHSYALEYLQGIIDRFACGFVGAESEIYPFVSEPFPQGHSLGFESHR